MHVRRIALSTLLTIGMIIPPATAKVPKDVSERAISTLLDGSRDADFTTRALAVAGLQFAPKKRVAATLKEALEDPQWQVGRAVIQVLVAWGDKRWKVAAANAMRSTRLDPLKEVLPLIEPAGVKRVIPVIKKALNDPKFPSPDRYARALAAKGGDWLVQGYLVGLKVKPKTTREAFIENLGKLKLPDALPLYRKIMKKLPAATQIKILDQVLDDGKSKDLSFLKPLLKSKDDKVKHRVAFALTERGDKAGRKVVLEVLEGGDEKNKLRALHALKFAADKSLIPYLKAFTRDPNVSEKLLRAALEIHAVLKTPSLVPWLKKQIFGKLVRSIGIQAAAIAVLGKVQGAPALPTLFRLIDHGAPAVRIAVANALRDLGRPASVPKISVRLQDETDPAVTIAFIDALGAIQSPSSVRPLSQFILHENPKVQKAAVHALSKIRHQSAIEFLDMAITNVRSLELRRVAIVAMLRLGPTKNMKAFERALGWLTGGDLRSLVKEHRRAMLPHVQMAIESTRSGARTAGLAALSALDKRGQETLLRRMVDHNSRAEMRIAGLRGLVRLVGKKAIPSATKLAADKNRDVRVAALQVLGQLKAKKASAVIIKALNDLDKRVQVAASEAALRI